MALSGKATAGYIIMQLWDQKLLQLCFSRNLAFSSCAIWDSHRWGHSVLTHFSRSRAYYTSRAWVPQQHIAWSNCHSGYLWSYEMVGLLTLGRDKMSLNGRWSLLVFRNPWTFDKIHSADIVPFMYITALEGYQTHSEHHRWTFWRPFDQLVTKELLTENWRSRSIITGETQGKSFGSL